MNSERNLIIDQIKGVGMLCVIFIHGSWLSGAQGIPHSVMSNLSRIAVPYFIILFCYFTERSLIKSEKHNQINYYLKRFKSLFIPFFVWSLVYFLLRVDFTNILSNPIKIITTYWIGSGWGGQFFFIVLFQLIIIFPLLRKLAQNRVIVALTLAVTAILCIIQTYFLNIVPSILVTINDRLVLYWIAYAFLGILMAHNVSKHDTSKWLLMTIALIPIESIFHNDTPSPYLKLSILIAAYLTLPLLVSFSSSQIEGQIGKIISLFGKHSMSLFVLNPLIIILLEKTSVFPLHIENILLSYITSLVLVVLIALLALAASFLIRRSPFSRLV
ncbi:acyltransferase family protein [Tumidithrix elongata]|uniref:acyltransferase family protein n=1 Tax=Tumidithrix elongata TaxID=3088357 RepID=UPI0038CD511C